MLARSAGVIAATVSRAWASSPSVGPQPVGASGSTVGDAGEEVEASGDPEPALRGAASVPEEQPLSASRTARAAAARVVGAAVVRRIAVVLIAVHCVIPPTLARWPTRWRRAP